MKTPEYWYRYENDAQGNVDYTEYEVLKHTPKGVWLKIGYNDDKFVLKDARKRFAYPDRKLALESFIARKHSQRKIVRRQIDRVEKAIIAGQAIKAGLTPPHYPAPRATSLWLEDY